MVKRINFQFDDELKHQSEAIKSTIELFRGVSRNSIIANSIYKYEKKIDGYHDVEQRRNENIVIGTKLFENLKKVQFDNNLFYDEKLAVLLCLSIVYLLVFYSQKMNIKIKA